MFLSADAMPMPMPINVLAHQAYVRLLEQAASDAAETQSELRRRLAEAPAQVATCRLLASLACIIVHSSRSSFRFLTWAVVFARPHDSFVDEVVIHESFL